MAREALGSISNPPTWSTTESSWTRFASTRTNRRSPSRTRPRVGRWISKRPFESMTKERFDHRSSASPGKTAIDGRRLGEKIGEGRSVDRRAASVLQTLLALLGRGHAQCVDVFEGANGSLQPRTAPSRKLQLEDRVSIERGDRGRDREAVEGAEERAAQPRVVSTRLLLRRHGSDPIVVRSHPERSRADSGPRPSR